MNGKYVVVTNGKLSEPMSREDAIKAVKSYDNKAINAYMVSEDEAERIKASENFNTPKWE